MSGGPPASDSASFWERIYRERTRPSSGQPNPILARIATPLAPGSALDLGCSLGDDAIWLAGHEWSVTAVDVSDTALERASQRADELGLADGLDFQQHDLGLSFPTGEFDLIYALYLQSPIEFGRDEVLRRAAEAVAPGGRLLVVVHGSHRPWGWDQQKKHTRFPTPHEQLAALRLRSEDWTTEICDTSYRKATGPHGETATVTDIVTMARRNARDDVSV